MEDHVIRIVTDTDSNITQELMDKHAIEAAPIYIHFGEEAVREHYEITPTQFYQRMAGMHRLPTTSQPPVGEFVSIYERLLAEDPETTIISLHISGKVSGTVESARQAAALLPEADIRVMDTRTVSLGQTMMALEAARMGEEGRSADEIMTRMEIMRDQTQVLFALNTLEYLAKGGRIGKASHLLGTVMAIKPLLTVTEEGVIDANGRFRTWKRALVGLKERVIEEVPSAADRGESDRLHLGVVHAVNPDEALPVYEALTEALQPDVQVIAEIGPGLGVHVGPGTIGVCWAFSPR
jgi:DegV family protein with EDD domain